MGRSKKIAIAPVVGFLMGLYPGIQYALNQMNDDSQGGTSGSRFMNGMLYAYAGVDHDTNGKAVFNWDGVMVGTVPLIAGAVGGYAIHKLAAKMGVNKNIPFVSL